MAMVDPSKRKAELKEQGIDPENPGERPKITILNKWTPCVITNFCETASRAGKLGWLVWFTVCDPASPDFKKSAGRKFWRSEDSASFFADLAIAVGWDTPFDLDNEDTIASILASNEGVVMVKFGDNTYQGKTRIEPKYFGRAKAIPEASAIDAASEEGKKSWESYTDFLERMEARRESGGDSESGGGSHNRGARDPDDTIPF